VSRLEEITINAELAETAETDFSKLFAEQLCELGVLCGNVARHGT